MSWLKQYLHERGIIAKVCIDAIKVSKPTWSKILQDPTILSVSQLKSLAYILKFTPEEFLKLILMYDEIE